MKIKEIMTCNPLVLKPEQTAREVVEIFSENKIDGAPVVDDDHRLIGIFTKTHIYRMIINNMDMDTQVGSMMTQGPFLTGYPDDEFEDVVTPQVPRLPVVNDTGVVVGILTRGDIARAFFDSYRSISRQLDAIINSTHNMIISVDEQGKIKVFNRAAEKTLVMKAEEVIGKTITQVLPTSRLMNVIRTGKPEPLQEIKLKGRNFISNRSPITKDGKIIGAVAVLQDISDIEKVSKELKYIKELNEEFNAIFDSSFDGLYICDGQGTTLRLNKAFEMISGVDGSEFMGRNVAEIEKEGIVSKSVSRMVLEKKEPATIIQKTKVGNTTLATGTPIFDDKGNIFRVVSNVRDITELNMLKQELEQAQGLTQHYENELQTLRLRYAGSNNMVINSPNMQKLMELVIRLARVDSTVLITGVSGTGKELIADTIHRNSRRKRVLLLKLIVEQYRKTYWNQSCLGMNLERLRGLKEKANQDILKLPQVEYYFWMKLVNFLWDYR